MKAVYAIRTSTEGTRFTLDRVDDRDLVEYTEAKDIMRFYVTTWCDVDDDRLRMSQIVFDEVVNKILTQYGRNGRAMGVQAAPGPRKSVPAIPFEVWASPPKDIDYMAAVRAMCGGG